MKNISAIIVAKDNSPYLTSSIQSITPLVKEIVIVDIGLEKAILEEVITYPLVKITKHETVPYVELIREKSKAFASYDYVLFLDPDEELTPQLVNGITMHIDEADYFVIPRKNLIFGKWMRHSRWWPDYQVRLFKKECAIWPTRIHKQPALSGRKHQFDAKEEYGIVHHNYDTVDQFMEKLIRYAKAEANEHAQNNDYPLAKALTIAVHEFISRFFAEKGYLDGFHGLILSILQMFYPILVYIYLSEIKKFQVSLSPEEIRNTPIVLFGKLVKESLFWKKKTGSSNIKETIIEKFLP